MTEPTEPSASGGLSGDLVAVFRTADAGLLALLKTVLEAAEIPYVVQGGGALRMLPLGPLATGISRNLLAATILVSPDRAEEARALLSSHVEDAPG